MKPSPKLRYFLLLAASSLLAVFSPSALHAQTVDLDLTTNNSGGITLSNGDTYTFSYAGLAVDYLIVGGGGGGGGGISSAGGGGGGGAGGLLEGQNLVIGGAQTIVVGAGGAGGTSGNTVGSTYAGNKGNDSTAFSLIAEGGGFGGRFDSGGGAGGSGGGAAARGSLTGGTGGTGTSGQGFDGGTRTGTSKGASSGGGAGGAGIGGGSNNTGRNGGAAVTRNITGASVVYAGGGGGGGDAGGTSATGGTGGAGAGNGSSGAANTGGGGGGGGTSGGNGGDGGSGIVVVRYSGAQVLSGGTVSTVGGDTVHTFTTTGTSSLDLHSATVAGDISGSGNLNWNKTGTLTLSGNNSYEGTTTVSTGTLEVTGSGSINDSTNLTVASGATFRYNSSTALSVGSITNNGAIQISGTGDIGVNLGFNSTDDILSPGNSPGVQNYTVSQTWSSMTYEWETNNFTGTTAGTDFDQIAIDGNLTLTGSMAGSYVLDLFSLTNLDAQGDVFNFAETSRSWDILTTTGTIGGFDLSYWTIDDSAFTSNPAWQGAWNLDVNGSNNALVLSYTAIPEPTAALLGSLGLLALLRRRR